MKKITIFSLVLGYGGIENYISKLCLMLYQKYSIEIICTYKVDEKPAFDFPKNVKIKYLIDENPNSESLRSLIKHLKIISVLKNLLKRLGLKTRAKYLNIKTIKNIDTDIIITTRNYFHVLISKYIKNNKVLLVATEHNFHQNNKKYIHALTNSVKKFDYLIVPTKELYDDYKDNIGNCECIKIPHPLDNIPKEKSNLKCLNIISVGRFSSEKGFFDLIDVFKIIHEKLPIAKLYLIGDGYQGKKLKDYVNLNNLNDFVIMPGFKSLEEQKQYYLDSTLFVMTSYTEAFGLVLIEAMGYGVPCIAFDCASGARELINKDIGVLIENRNKEKMADVIVRMLKNKNILYTYQKNLNNYIKKFDMDNIKKKYYNILK